MYFKCLLTCFFTFIAVSTSYAQQHNMVFPDVSGKKTVINSGSSLINTPSKWDN
ncbi:MAG: hypothetical protein IPO92_06135 [Saprospiraceae bacterium]|nr:hypothetical protein [Saprospiraceae bacterium]